MNWVPSRKKLPGISTNSLTVSDMAALSRLSCLSVKGACVRGNGGVHSLSQCDTWRRLPRILTDLTMPFLPKSVPNVTLHYQLFLAFLRSTLTSIDETWLQLGVSSACFGQGCVLIRDRWHHRVSATTRRLQSPSHHQQQQLQRRPPLPTRTLFKQEGKAAQRRM